MCDHDNNRDVELDIDTMTCVKYVDVVLHQYMKNPSNQLLENSNLSFVPSSPVPSSMSSWLNPLKILRKENHKNLSIHLDMAQF